MLYFFLLLLLLFFLVILFYLVTSNPRCYLMYTDSIPPHSTMVHRSLNALCLLRRKEELSCLIFYLDLRTLAGRPRYKKKEHIIIRCRSWRKLIFIITNSTTLERNTSKLLLRLWSEILFFPLSKHYFFRLCSPTSTPPLITKVVKKY